MQLFGLGAGFQTSFVVAVLVAVVFLAQRLGGDAELLRRGMQVAIGLALGLLVLSATTAFIRPGEAPPQQTVFSTGDSQNQNQSLEYLHDAADKASAAGTIHIAAGLLLAIGGVAIFRRLRLLPMGIALGGILLLLLGAPPSSAGASDPYSAYVLAALSLSATAQQGWDIARFVVLLGGTIGLMAFVYARWELPEVGASRNGEAPPEQPLPVNAE